VLLSVAILGGAMAFILQAFGRGAQSLVLARRHLLAQQFAAAKLTDVLMSLERGVEPREAGQFRDGQDVFRWRLHRAPAPGDLPLEAVTLTIEWPRGAARSEASVTTWRYAPPPPP
jgi:hypothetical protein